jgi:hypothetical protein
MTSKSNLLLALAAAIFAGSVPALHARRFEEPSVMNLPYTQMVEDPFFGDYDGTFTPSDLRVQDGGPAPVVAAAQVVAQGHHQYKVVLRAKPSDPEAWPLQIELDGRIEGDRVLVSGYAGGHEWEGEISKQHLRVNKRGYGGVFEMKRVMKKSPTEGAPPPADAIVLLASTPGQAPALDEWKDPDWVTTADGIMHKHTADPARPDAGRRDISTKREFRNVRLHVEFRIPYEPDQREQARGNSGVILADRYEVQVLDSYGIVSGTGDCAGIYSVAPPRVNAAFPPLSWQTYDITFYAPKLDEAGKLVRAPRFTVIWNGVKVHENQTTPTPTGDANRPNAAAGPLRIQDHGNLVYYRNIWIEEIPDSDP